MSFDHTLERLRDASPEVRDAALIGLDGVVIARSGAGGSDAVDAAAAAFAEVLRRTGSAHRGAELGEPTEMVVATADGAATTTTSGAAEPDAPGPPLTRRSLNPSRSSSNVEKLLWEMSSIRSRSSLPSTRPPAENGGEAYHPFPGGGNDCRAAPS